jgi:hypothetical protein
MTEKKDVELIASGIKGVWLVVEKGIEKLKISLPILKKFYTLIKEYRSVERKEEEIIEKKETLKEKLVSIVLANPGLKGLQTEADNLRTSIYKSKAVIGYNREPLKKCLGPAYEGVVKEDLQFTIILTSDYNQDELVQYLHQFFKDENTYQKMVKEEILLRVDEEKLNELIIKGKVKLSEEATTEKKKSAWYVKTTLIKS